MEVGGGLLGSGGDWGGEVGSRRRGSSAAFTKPCDQCSLYAFATY